MDKKIALGFYILAAGSFVFFVNFPILPSYPAPFPCNGNLPVSCAFQQNPMDYIFPLAILAVGIFIQIYGKRIEDE